MSIDADEWDIFSTNNWNEISYKSCRVNETTKNQYNTSKLKYKNASRYGRYDKICGDTGI